MYKSLKRGLLGAINRTPLLDLAQRLEGKVGQSLYVVVHHRVAGPNPAVHLNPDLVNATPEQLDNQFRLIANHYRAVAAEQVVNSAAGGKPLPRDAVLVTVDDAYRDFKEVIWPTAKRYGIYPVLFVPTGFVGEGGFWWDRLYNALRLSRQAVLATPLGPFQLQIPGEKRRLLKELDQFVIASKPFARALGMVEELIEALQSDLLLSERPLPDQSTLDWNELRQLAREGVTLAPHTHTHPALGNIEGAQVHAEIAESRRLLTQEIGPTLPIFAYPYGSTSALSMQVREIAHQEGLQLAFTMLPGRANLEQDDKLWLPRLPSATTYTPAQFHAQLTPVYDFVRRRQRKAERKPSP